MSSAAPIPDHFESGPDDYVFMRTDGLATLDLNLPTITKSPHQHMNLDGQHDYTDSGYLSVFMYSKDHVLMGYDSDGNIFKMSSAVKGMSDVQKKWVHILIVRSSVPIIGLDSDSAKDIPTGTGARIYSTVGVTKIPQHLRVKFYVDVHEYLLAGKISDYCITCDLPWDSSLFQSIKLSNPALPI
jgi:hypothetical protein